MASPPTHRMTDESYRPREKDHLVEPMFAGLGVGQDERTETTEEAPIERAEPGFFVRLARRVARVSRRTRDR